MASPQTVFSELSVALGILGHNVEQVDKLYSILNVTKEDVEKYISQLRKPKREEVGKELVSVGKIIRERARDFGLTEPAVAWVGSEKVGLVENAAKDIEIVGLVPTRISIKESSKVIINGGPSRIFEKLPRGEFEKTKGEHWFLRVASEEYQAYYEACGGPKQTSIDNVKDFERLKLKDQIRIEFKERVTSLHDKKVAAVDKAYRALCERVSSMSAEIFNKNIEDTKRHKSGKERLGLIFHTLFMIDASSYLLAGIEKKGNEKVAFIIQSSGEWKKGYQLLDIKAEAKSAGQPEVLIVVRLKDLSRREEFSLNIKAEVRWTHGKFGGQPEAKLYRMWDFMDLPWAKNIMS